MDNKMHLVFGEKLLTEYLGDNSKDSKVEMHHGSRDFEVVGDD